MERRYCRQLLVSIRDYKNGRGLDPCIFVFSLGQGFSEGALWPVTAKHCRWGPPPTPPSNDGVSGLPICCELTVRGEGIGDSMEGT